jgi:hypothetical protein
MTIVPKVAARAAAKALSISMWLGIRLSYNNCSRNSARADSFYKSGRSCNWLKTKNSNFVRA